MADSKFNEYYKEICERDQMILEETPLPEPKGNNIWTVFGLSLGIASIIFAFLTQYDIILGAFAMVLSIVGYTKKKNNVTLAGIICSAIGICLTIIFTVVGYFVIKMF